MRGSASTHAAHVFLFGALALGGVSCLDDTTNLDVPGFEFDATLTGRVLSQPEGTPLAGANYELVGTTSGTTDAQGQLRIANLGEGTFDLNVSAPGHATSRLSFVVSAGQRTQGRVSLHLQRDVWLYEKTASLEVRVLESIEGRPAIDATVDLAWSDSPSLPGHTIIDVSVPRSVQTDSSGMVILNSVPAMPVRIMVAPYDLDGDGIPEFRTSFQEVTLRPSTKQNATIILTRDFGGSIQVVNTNLPGCCSNSFGSATAVLVFSAFMDTGSGVSTATLLEESTNEILPVSLDWATNIRLDVSLPAQTMVAGNRYRLFMSGASEGGRSWQTEYRFIWSADGGGGLPGGDCADLVADLRLDSSIGAIDYDTQSVQLAWTAVPCARGYKIYAKDTRDNTDWQFLKNDPNDFETGTISTAVILPPGFDRFFVDEVQTPFAGIEVEFSVVPMQAVDADPGPPHGTLRLADNTRPGVEDFGQVGSGVNFSGAAEQLDLTVQFSELISSGVADPILEVQEAGGDPNFQLDPGTATWHWDSGRHRGRATFVLQDGQNAANDRIRAVFTDFADLSGNIVPGQIASPWYTIQSIASFDFEDSPQGWTRTGQGWEWGTPTTGPRGAHSGQKVWATNLHNSYGPNWNTSLTSRPIYVDPANPELRFWSWSYVYTGDQLRIIAIDGASQTDLGSINLCCGGWRENTYSLSSSAGRSVRIAFEFTSDGSSENSGVFIDDVCVSCQ